jgi:hypothetical protein
MHLVQRASGRYEAHVQLEPGHTAPLEALEIVSIGFVIASATAFCVGRSVSVCIILPDVPLGNGAAV